MSIQTIKSFMQEDAGQDLVEYALLMGFLSLAAIAVLTTAGGNIKTIWGNINTGLTAAAAAS
jgi:Flp pilus assembly pilin Flp